MVYNFDNFKRRRMSNHNKITFATKYLLMSHLGDDVISHVTIAELGFFCCCDKISSLGLNKIAYLRFGCVEHLKIT